MQARSLFKAKRYLQARHCFQRAEQPYKAAVANAYYLRDGARAKPVTASKRSQDGRTEAFFAAAEAFLNCATVGASGANDRERSGYYRRAGDCYEEAGRTYFRLAAEVRYFNDLTAQLFTIPSALSALAIWQMFVKCAQNCMSTPRGYTAMLPNLTTQYASYNNTTWRPMKMAPESLLQQSCSTLIAMRFSTFPCVRGVLTLTVTQQRLSALQRGPGSDRVL